jgi:hypothetical protein
MVEFRRASEVAEEPHVMADGPPLPGSKLVLSHWPDSGTPWPLKADLSAEIAFNYLDAPEWHVDVPWVTNDHLDVDGFVTVFALCHPAAALERRTTLIEVAAAGDFACRCSNRAANVAFAIGAMRDPAVSALPVESFRGSASDVAAAHYELLLPRFVDLVDRIDDHEELWRDERETLDRADRAFDSGELRIDDVPTADLAIVWIPHGWDPGTQRGVLQRHTPVHPMAVHRRTDRWRVAYVNPTDHMFRLGYRFESWVQLTTARAGRADLRPLATALTAADPAPGDWIANGRKTFLAWLRRRDDGPSGLDADSFLQIVTNVLSATEISWRPYDPRTATRTPPERPSA